VLKHSENAIERAENIKIISTILLYCRRTCRRCVRSSRVLTAKTHASRVRHAIRRVGERITAYDTVASALLPPYKYQHNLFAKHGSNMLLTEPAGGVPQSPTPQVWAVASEKAEAARRAKIESFMMGMQLWLVLKRDKL